MSSARFFQCAILAFVVAAFTLAGERPAAAVTAGDGFSAIPGSFKPTTDVDLGAFSSPNMTVEVALAPRNESQLSALLTSLYDSNSASYQQWLGKGEFYSRFAPSEAQIAAVAAHLQASGLIVQPSSSPFLVRASGPSSVVEAAFKTTLHSYRNSKGTSYFSNTSDVHLPASVATGVLGVVGLSNTVRMRSHPVRPLNHGTPPTPGCETPYVTSEQLFDYVNNGVGFPYGYGGGPGCNGLTPSQDNSIYGAPDLGPGGQGAGVKLAVFELSAYQHSDIQTWAHYFYGPRYTPPLVDITVDGGPLAPVCPAGDTCPPDFNGYAGDIEVDADIEMQLAISPAAKNILVYNAPNDYTGQTELDEYTQIANDDIADVVSSSWSVCENDVTAAYVQAENEALGASVTHTRRAGVCLRKHPHGGPRGRHAARRSPPPACPLIPVLLSSWFSSPSLDLQVLALLAAGAPHNQASHPQPRPVAAQRPFRPVRASCRQQTGHPRLACSRQCCARTSG